MLSQERQLLCLSPVVAPSSTGWQACPAFKDTSVPTGHLEASLESLWWKEHFPSSSHAFLHSPSPPQVSTSVLTWDAHTLSPPKKVCTVTALTMEQVWGSLSISYV